MKLLFQIMFNVVSAGLFSGVNKYAIANVDFHATKLAQVMHAVVGSFFGGIFGLVRSLFGGSTAVNEQFVAQAATA